MSDVVDKKQKLLLEYLLADREVFLKCFRICKPSYFEPPLDRAVSYILDHFHKHHDIPNKDIIEAETTIVLVDREMENDDKSYFLEEFENHCKTAAMTEAVLSSVEHIQAGNHQEVQELVRNALLVKIDNSVGVNLFDNPLSRIENMATNVDERSMGIPEIDELIGKVRRGELGVFFAGTAVGKSVTLANAAVTMAQQKLDTLIISIELNEELYSKRLDTILTGWDIKSHAENAEKIAEHLMSVVDDYGVIVSKKVPYGSSPADVRAVVMEFCLVYGKPPDVLIVDYLGLMGGTRKSGMNKFDEDELKAFGIRDLCVDYDMYGFTAGQVNRDGYGVVDLGPQHVAGGISVINAADWAVGLVASEQDIDNNQLQAIQMKVRNGGKTRKPVVLYRCPYTLRLSGEPFAANKIKNLEAPKPSFNQVGGQQKSAGKQKLDALLKRGKPK